MKKNIRFAFIYLLNKSYLYQLLFKFTAFECTKATG